uniref:Uncharacterized protein n=1 Tax=Arundo donax TaxID=35708 RepID=A0A0A9BWJ1_ARUDO
MIITLFNKSSLLHISPPLAPSTEKKKDMLNI